MIVCLEYLKMTAVVNIMWTTTVMRLLSRQWMTRNIIWSGRPSKACLRGFLPARNLSGISIKHVKVRCITTVEGIGYEWISRRGANKQMYCLSEESFLTFIGVSLF